MWAGRGDLPHRRPLDGIWLPQGVYDRAPGREVLSGAPDLTGRYQITLGRNPWGGHYAGYVDLERTGDRVKVSWHLTSEVFVGSGIKIGNVLAVAYGYTHAPAVAAYCSNGRQLEGAWWTGPTGLSGEETLKPVAGSGAEISACRGRTRTTHAVRRSRPTGSHVPCR
jgi:hypothetical protein